MRLPLSSWCSGEGSITLPNGEVFVKSFHTEFEKDPCLLINIYCIMQIGRSLLCLDMHALPSPSTMTMTMKIALRLRGQPPWMIEALCDEGQRFMVSFRETCFLRAPPKGIVDKMCKEYSLLDTLYFCVARIVFVLDSIIQIGLRTGPTQALHMFNTSVLSIPYYTLAMFSSCLIRTGLHVPSSPSFTQSHKLAPKLSSCSATTQSLESINLQSIVQYSNCSILPDLLCP